MIANDEIRRWQEHEEARVRAKLILREPPRFGESAADYIARAERELSSVTPPPVVEHRNEAPLRARFSVLPPGTVSWTERGWAAWGRHVLRQRRAAS